MMPANLGNHMRLRYRLQFICPPRPLEKCADVFATPSVASHHQLDHRIIQEVVEGLFFLRHPSSPRLLPTHLDEVAKVTPQ